MFLKQVQECNYHEWTSKAGNKFLKPVRVTVFYLCCDNCKEEFTRNRGEMSRERANNNYEHFCNSCFNFGMVARRGHDSQIRHWEEKIGKRYIDAAGYPVVYVGPKNSAKRKGSRYGSVREHILLMERHLGRSLASGEVVHHIDGNKQNNELSNLDLCTVEQHNRCHATSEKIVFQLYKDGIVGYDNKNKEYFLKKH